MARICRINEVSDERLRPSIMCSISHQEWLGQWDLPKARARGFDTRTRADDVSGGRWMFLSDRNFVELERGRQQGLYVGSGELG